MSKIPSYLGVHTRSGERLANGSYYSLNEDKFEMEKVNEFRAKKTGIPVDQLESCSFVVQYNSDGSIMDVIENVELTSEKPFDYVR